MDIKQKVDVTGQTGGSAFIQPEQADAVNSPIRIKSEYNLIGKLDEICSLPTTSINTTSYLALDRMKIEPTTIENGGMSAVDKIETFESKMSIGRIKLENIESMELREQSDIKATSILYTELYLRDDKDITLSDISPERVKTENSISEMWDRPDLCTVDKMDKIKAADSQVFINETKSEYMDSTELTEQLNIKRGIESNMLHSELDIKDEEDVDDDSDTHLSDLATKSSLITESSHKAASKFKMPHCGSSRKCVHCNATFKRKPQLDDHVIRKHPDFIASVTSKIHECTKCTFKTTFISSLNRHLLKHPETAAGYKLSTCVHCFTGFKRKIHLDDHVIRKHPDFIASVTSKIHKCKKCSFKTSVISNLNRHLLKHAETAAGYKFSTCVHCFAVYKRKRYLEDHIISKHPDFIASVTSKINKCTKCTFKTTSRSSLDKHLLKHPETAASYKLSTCIHCTATYKNKRSLDDHILQKHPMFIESVTSKIHECAMCTFKTTTVSEFHRHLLKHPETAAAYKFRKCIHCNDEFRTKSLLGNHIIKKHPSFIDSITSKIHECTKCTYKTTVSNDLKNHLVKHPETAASYKRQTCIHCSAAFMNKRSLDEHMIKKHPSFISSITSKIHKCAKCTYKTTMSSDLKKHLMKHSETGASYKL